MTFMSSNKSHGALNLEDIARLSGSSRSTVSRVINGHPNVSPAVRERILKVIEERGYRPNHAARALASQRYKVFGVLIPHVVIDIFSDPFFPRLLQAITFEASSQGYSVTLGLMSDERDYSAFYDHMFNNGLSDGYIIASATFEDALIERLQSQVKPYVIVGQPPESLANATYVDSMNEDGARLIVHHLIERGYERIATIPGRHGLTSTLHRLNGYKRALQDAGRRVDPALIAPHGAYTEAGGYAGMQALLRQSQPIDAVFCANDLMALGAMRAITQAGLRIPQDIAVCGFDDLPSASNTLPPLTTVRQHIDDLGFAAARSLISILEGQQEAPFYQRLPVELVIRDST